MAPQHLGIQDSIKRCQVALPIINLRAGGMSLITGRKVFERPMEEVIALLHLVQGVYLDASITVA